MMDACFGLCVVDKKYKAANWLSTVCMCVCVCTFAEEEKNYIANELDV